MARHDLDDVHQFSESLNGWQQDYQQLGRGRFHGDLLQIALPEGGFLREVTDLHLQEHMVPPRDHLVFGLPLRVEPGSLFNGRALTPQTVVVLEGGKPCEILASGLIDMVGLAVHTAVLEQWLGDEDLDVVDHMRRRGCAVVDAASRPAMGSALLQSIADMQALPDDAAHAQRHLGVLRRALSDTLSALRQDAADPDADRLVGRSFGRRRQVVGAAVAFMQAHLSEPLTIGDVCRAVGVSHRSLQYCFEAFRSTTPQQYLLAMRLTEARRRLRSASHPNITDLALALGFSSSSHFSAQYKRMFGEQPSATLDQSADSSSFASRSLSATT